MKYESSRRPAAAASSAAFPHWASSAGGAVRRAATLVALAVTVATVTLACSASSSAERHASVRVSYYLSLGDSLSVGVQPDAAGKSLPTEQGYANQLYAALRVGDPGLRLVKLGCSGETTHTMIDGGICSYPVHSQLAEAVRFLRAHRGKVSLVTIDIGANDPDSCISRASLGAIVSCVTKSFPETVANLTKIMSSIRAAAGGKARIVGMNYYVPALSQWRDGPRGPHHPPRCQRRHGPLGQQLARLSERLVVGYNKLLATVYQQFGARIANVFGAFHSGDFTDQVRVPGIGTVPRNVAAICLWTWECAASPRGPNEHARPIGYGVIALAFLLALRA
jgi:lysophospholipase L1-like esterase